MCDIKFHSNKFVYIQHAKDSQLDVAFYLLTTNICFLKIFNKKKFLKVSTTLTVTAL